MPRPLFDRPQARIRLGPAAGHNEDRKPICIRASERIENTKASRPETPMFFTFPEDARWNEDRRAVEFGVEIGEYRGGVRGTQRVFQCLLTERPTPERCVEAYYLQRTRFECIAERKLRRRQLTEDGNVEITGVDLGGHMQGSLEV